MKSLQTLFASRPQSSATVSRKERELRRARQRLSRRKGQCERLDERSLMAADLAVFEMGPPISDTDSIGERHAILVKYNAADHQASDSAISDVVRDRREILPGLFRLDFAD